MHYFTFLFIMTLSIITTGCSGGGSGSSSPSSTGQVAVKCNPDAICAPSQVAIVQGQK